MFVYFIKDNVKHYIRTVNSYEEFQILQNEFKNIKLYIED